MKRNILTLVAGIAVLAASAQTKVIAHRGYWKAQGASQNSIAALVKADEAKCYGSEFDVWITADDQIVVNHDDNFKGKKMETSTLAELQSLKLSNGEKMPSLEEYLDTASKLTVRLVLELKAHSSAKRENLAVEKILALVKKYGLENRTEYISFSLNACKEFVAKAPKGTPVYYLNGELSPKALKHLGLAGLDYHTSILRDKHPEWISEAHQLGLKVNCWTVDSRNDMQWLVEHHVDFITTNEPAQLQQVLEATSK